jgi:EcsC protein family
MNKPPVIYRLPQDDLRDLELAKSLLERPGFAIRMANLIGSPIEKGFALLPQGWNAVVNTAARAALLRSLALAVSTLGKRNRHRARELFHKVLAGTSGCVGGAFGLAALPLELPFSTAVMLRSIADIARSEGHKLSLLQTRLQCLEVFALGGHASGADSTDSAYWITRTALSKTVSEAASYLTQKGVLKETAPVIVRLVNELASRFGIMVSEELAAKAMPIIGAAAGGTINVLFTAHFQNLARGHFIVKRLEARHGLPLIQGIYEEIEI